MHLFVGFLALMKYEFQYLLDINGRVSTQLSGLMMRVQLPISMYATSGIQSEVVEGIPVRGLAPVQYLRARGRRA